MNIYVLILMFVMIGYLFGSTNFAILIGKTFYKKDIREFGSKNAGATNAGRVFGKQAFFAVMILDIMKGVTAYLLSLLILNLLKENGNADFTKFNLAQFAAVGAFIGHLFPLYYGFKGGKGVTTGFATIAVVNPGVAGMLIVGWAVILISTKMMSVASIFGCIAIIVLVWTIPADFATPVTMNFVSNVIVTTIAGLIILKHHQNISRIFKGEEKQLKFAK